MTQKTIEHINKSDSLWLSIIVIGLLSFLIPLLIRIIFSNQEFVGLIVIVPMMILYLILLKGLIKLKIIRFSENLIEITNYWNRKIRVVLHPRNFSKMIYWVPMKSIPPYSAIKITVYEDGLKYEFSVKGFYPEDLIKYFDRYGFPIYQQMMDQTTKRMN